MRWLLAKDLRILARSRTLVAVLVLYPAAVSVLIGLAISRSPGAPKVAIVDETPPGQTVPVGTRRVEIGRYAEKLFSQVQPVRAATRQQAEQEVRSGKALAAVVIPADIAARVSSGLQKGRLEVLYDGNALEQSLVSSQLDAALAQANLGFSEQIQSAVAQGIGLLLRGGPSGIAGAPANLIGLERIPPQLGAIIARQPPGADRTALERMQVFASFAAENLKLAKVVLSAIGQPIAIQSRLIQGRRTPLNTFAVVVAVSISLMFACVLLASGSMALEREEHAAGRLLRGLVSRRLLLAEKVVLAAGCSFLLAFAMLAAISGFVTLEWHRVGLWLVALALGALSFGALGVAIGALVRDVRAASLLAILLSLPLALLALVPRGSVAAGIYDAVAAISFAFPFKASLQALDNAVNGAAPSLAGAAIHAAALTLVFGALARLGLRRAE